MRACYPAGVRNVIGCTLWIFCAIAYPSAAAPTTYAGRPLTEVLLSLERKGLTIVFTSELVRPDMIVAGEPAAGEPRRLLEEVLAPFGLGVEEAPGGLLVIVAKGKATAEITGSVLARESRRALAGAVVRVVDGRTQALARADGSFVLSDIEPGSHLVEASAEGYLAERVPVSIAPGSASRIAFYLRPQPVFRDEIAVQPSRLSLLHDPADSSLSFGREEIDTLPHLGGDVFRTTPLLPGVTANDDSARFSVHGGNRDEVAVLLDGQELYDPYHLQDYDGALSFVPARILASASLTTGAWPASRGDRMSGLLDLRTADPPPGRRFVLALSVLDALAASSGRFAAGRGSWLVSGRRGSFDLARDVIGNEDPQFGDAFGKAELATRLGLVGAHVLAASDVLEIDRTEEEDVERFENRYHSVYGWLTHEAAPSSRLLVSTLGSWAEIRRRRGGAGTDEEGAFALNDRQDHRIVALQQTWSLEAAARQVLQAGWEARRYDARFDYAQRIEPAVVILAPFAPPRRTEERVAAALRSEHWGVWGSDLLSWRDWTAELGARYDRYSATGEGLWSPRLNVARRCGERSLVRGSWGRFFQSQRPYELLVENGETALRHAERSEHWVLGAETALSSRRRGLDSLRVELFRREVSTPRPRFESLLEPVNFFPEIEPDRVLAAPRRSRSRGIELMLQGRSTARGDWRLAYSYARSEDQLAGAWMPRPYDQPHALTLDVNLPLGAAWNLNLAWRYHTGWPVTPVTAERVPSAGDPEETRLGGVFGALNGERLPPYHRLDLRASRRWSLRAGTLTFFVDVQNLYDRQNLAGFSVRVDDEAGALFLDRETWAGIFPSLGFTWEL